MVSDTNLSQNIFQIGKRRERGIYLRRDGSETKLLPVDAMSQIYYGSKGFKLKIGASSPQTQIVDNINKE